MAEKKAVDPDEALFEEISAGLITYIFGKGEQSISKQLMEAQELGDTIGQITMTLVKEGMDQASGAGKELDLDIIMGVATEVIDSLIQLADALKLDVGDVEQLQAHSLIAAVNAYIMTANPSPEEREAAMFMLEQMEQDGTVDEGADQLDQMGAELPPGMEPQPGQQPAQQPQMPEQAMPQQAPPPQLMGG